MMTESRYRANRPLTLPPIRDPHLCVGLYVYDFGTHVSVGYTAAEIRILRESQAHRDGTAYEIYRVDDEGRIELRAVLDDRLDGWEAMCFLRSEAKAARRDYDALCKAADRHPAPCAAELRLGKLYAFRPPNVTALSYPAAASTMMARWLSQNAAGTGDHVVGGIDVHATVAGSDGVWIASCRLKALMDYRDRTAEEVLRATDEALQR